MCMRGWPAAFWAALSLALGPPLRAAPDADYLAGLAHLESGRWKDAAASFSRAREAAPDEARYPLALGVAQLLAEQAAAAQETLRRAHRLTGDRDPATRMWLGAALCMSGNLEQARLHGGFNHGDPYHKLVYDTFNTYGLSIFQAAQGVEPAQLAAWRGEAVAKFPQVAREFAARAKASGGAGVNRSLLEQAARLHGEGRLAEALTALEPVRASGHDDPYAGWLHGDLLARLDAPAAAREILTDVLVRAPDASAAFLSRAQAHARLGEAAAARWDLKHAFARAADDPRLRLPANAAELRRAVEADLARPAEKVEALLAGLSRASADWPAAVDLALRLRRAAGSSRIRWDETCQEAVRAAAWRALDAPRDADAWANLADLIDRQRPVWAEAVEPRANPRPWRRHDPEYELNRIGEAAERALALQPRHAGALASRAAVSVARGRDGAAEPDLRRALEIRDEPKALDLLIGMLTRAAAAKQTRAEGLRSPRVETSTERRSDGEYRVTRTYPPSAADLAEAARLEAEARAHLAEAKALYERLFQATRGTPAESFHRARHAWWQGDARRAGDLLAGILTPREAEPRFHHQMLEWMRHGDAAAYDEQFIDASTRFHTTAAGALRIAFRAVERGAVEASRAATARARSLDPADARGHAYAGIALDEQGRSADALPWYRAALALEEARLRERGRGLDAGRGRLGDDDWPLSASVGLRLALALERAGREAEGLDTLRALSRGLAGRVDLPDASITRRETMALAAGQLPTSQGDLSGAAPAPEGRALLAWMQVASGDALRRAGRGQEAGEAYLAALALNRGDEVRPLASYNRGEKTVLGAARDRIPVEILTRFDMAITLAEQGAIESGALKSARQIHQERMAERDKVYAAEGELMQEYRRRSTALNREQGQKQRSIDRFDRAGQQALREEYQKKSAELEAWREAEMRKLHGPGYR